MAQTASGATGRVAAIYARVSSERQREEGTIQSQLAGLRELAAERGLLVADDLIFEDEGFSGATLVRPALERLRDRAAEGAFEVLLCHAPDRLARRYAYQVLLLEELARAGVEVVFARGGERSGSPEDELLRQFQGMIAEYERAQIRERTRRGKLHRARTGHQAVMSGAPYGYRFVKKSEITDGYWEIVDSEAEVVREVFRRYTEDDCAIAELARWLTEEGIPTRKGKTVWDRSTVWGMLRNPAYRGQAAYGKTKVQDRHGRPTRTTRARGERHGRRQVRIDEPVEKWMFIPVPPLVTEQTFALAQERLAHNAHFAKRNTKKPTLLQGILVCRECGYACYRTSTRTTNKRIYYYRCIGSDNYRHIGGRVCHSRPIRADELDGLVWEHVRELLEDPALVRAEIDRRLEALRTEHPAARRREGLERDLRRAGAAIARLIEAYQEQLISLDELRARMPTLRKREATLHAQLDALDAELHDAETYLKLADTLEGFLSRLNAGLDQLTLEEQQRILRLVVREVLIGGDDDKITIRHSIPTPNGGPNGSCPLRGSSHRTSPVELVLPGDFRTPRLILGEPGGRSESGSGGIEHDVEVAVDLNIREREPVGVLGDALEEQVHARVRHTQALQCEPVDVAWK
jgi:site-specific DNA recombinase